MKNSRQSKLFFILLVASHLSCFKNRPEPTNPFDPAGESHSDAFDLRADPSYGQVILCWQTPSNLKSPVFQIDRKLPGAAGFSPLASTSDTTYTDGEVFVYDREVSYRISAIADGKQSEFSREVSTHSYPIPHILQTLTYTPLPAIAPNFKSGLVSRSDTTQMFVLDTENAQIRLMRISTDGFGNRRWSIKGKKNIVDFAVARVNDIEYLLAVSKSVNGSGHTLNVCKASEDSLSPLLRFDDEPKAIVSTERPDLAGVVYVAFSQQILKVNFLTAAIINQRSFADADFVFMTFNRAKAKLLLLSEKNKRLYLLDENLSLLQDPAIGEKPKNIVFSPATSESLFVCCESSREVRGFRFGHNILEPLGVIINSAQNGDQFIWTESAPGGTPKELLLLNLVHNQGSTPRFKIEIYRVAGNSGKATKVRVLNLPGPSQSFHVTSMKYASAPVGKLYIFARNALYYFLP